ncbi:MAG: DUF4974 domain-containing protein [Arachidicoccus sp.]|nr:DUF4974 domain-containing protein [Arachidicoccus sp.]
MDERAFKILFKKYIDKTISDTDREEFYRFVTMVGSIKLLRRFAEEYNLPENFHVELPNDIAQRILKNILPENTQKSARYFSFTNVKYKQYLFKYASVAALILLLVISCCLFLLNKKNNSALNAVGNRIIKDAMPGHFGAVLTLSNGKRYILDTAHNGLLTTGIRKLGKDLNILDGGEKTYATLATAYGQEQKLILNDGTTVWLNAGSSIRFPTIFVGNKRKVEITGEAYFEVAHDSYRPFIVEARGNEIQDLGTHFNVNAYNDEPSVKTTLLEGSVQIRGHVLKPGQQYENGSIKNIDPDIAVAWVSGFFQFDGTDIKTVMRQLSRWYNVRVEYEQAMIPNQKFEGEIQRSLKLSQVLELIAATGIHYTLDEGVLTIRS